MPTQDFVDRLSLISQRLATVNGSRAAIRDVFYKAVEDVKGLLEESLDSQEWFHYQSEPVSRLQVLIADLIGVLGEKVYIHQHTDETLLANEWLLMQNDLAELLELVEICPYLAESVGNYYGDLYVKKRMMFMKWIEKRAEVALKTNAMTPALVDMMDGFKEKLGAMLSCSRHYFNAFAMDSHLQMNEPINEGDLERVLAENKFVRLEEEHEGFRAYLSRNLASSQDTMKKFIETRINQPKIFRREFVMIIHVRDLVMTNTADTIKISKVSLENFWLHPMIQRDISEFNPHELLLAGRNSSQINLFMRQLAVRGFCLTSTFARESPTGFPVNYNGVMKYLRWNGLRATMILLKLAQHILKLDPFQPGHSQLGTLKWFNRLNGSLLYSIEFGASAVRLGSFMVDDQYIEFVGAFTPVAIDWISWLASFNHPDIPETTVNRWNVSAFDMLTPLWFLRVIQLEDHLNAEQIQKLQSAVDLLDEKKKRAKSDHISRVELVSQFKWKRVKHVIKGLAGEHVKLEPLKCDPIPTRFLPPIEELITTPLEKALAPLHYQLIAKIYTGPNATLFKCIDLNTGNYVAAKQFHIKEAVKRCQDEEIGVEEKEMTELKKALKETEMLKMVQGHPNVVRYLNSSYEQPNFFLFTEYYEGGSLADNRKLLHRSPSDTEALWRARYQLTRQIKEVLVHIHEIGLVHGDLKPANILLDGRGQVHLGDFGSSRNIPRSRQKCVPLCFEAGDDEMEQMTIPYMAPELITCHELTMASDIWAFGCLVLEFCTGMAPWDGLDPSEILVRLSEGQNPKDFAREALIGAPTRLLYLIDRCLVVEPAGRPQARSLLESHYLM